MAQLVIVTLEGGPANGVDLGYHVPPPLPRTINYVGNVYNLTDKTEKQTNLGATVRIYSFDKEATSLNAPGITGVTAAWTRLMRAIGVTVPHDLRAIHTETLRIRRLTRQHRR